MNPRLKGWSKNLKASWPMVTMKADMMVPVMLPMPPRTIISSILKVNVNLKSSGFIAPRRFPSRPPPTPAKNAPITKESTLCLKRFIPMASAAISSSRIALKALP